MYGKVMSWPDEMILPALEILTDLSDEAMLEIKDQMALKETNPRDIKMKLAYEIVKIYQGEKEAGKAEESFKRVFQDKQKPAEIAEVMISASKLKDGQIGVLDLFVAAGLAKSNGEVRRLIKEGGAMINDEKITSENLQVEITKAGLMLQRGRRQFAKAVLGK